MWVMGEWGVEDLGRVVRRAYPYSALGPRAFESVLDMLSGRYPSDDFAELRPRIVWDRVAGEVRGRGGAPAVAGSQPGASRDRGGYTRGRGGNGRAGWPGGRGKV